MRWSSILIFSFILNTFVFQAHCQVKMVLFYGIVLSGWESNVTNFKSVGDCTNGCLKAEHCFLMHFRTETCYFYSYLYGGQLTVSEVAQGHGAYVAFKTDISNIPNNTCPPSYKDLKFSVTSLSGEKYSWIKASSLWKFANCRTGWKRFERDDETVVCMKYFPPNGLYIQCVAITRCVEQNATLAGIASVEEAEWVQQYTILNATFGVWIGGAQDCPDDPCTTFVWTDEYTTLYDALNLAQVSQKKNSPYFEDCLAILPPKNDTDAIIFSQVCGLPLLASVCGYKIEF